MVFGRENMIEVGLAKIYPYFVEFFGSRFRSRVSVDVRYIELTKRVYKATHTHTHNWEILKGPPAVFFGI